MLMTLVALEKGTVLMLMMVAGTGKVDEADANDAGWLALEKGRC